MYNNDFVVEQGTSGIWTYRKWNSGIAECWGMTSLKTYDVTTASGKGYFCDVNTIVFPTSLFSAGITHIDATANSGGLIWCMVGGYSYNAVAVRLCSPNATTTAVRMQISAKGKWK